MNIGPSIDVAVSKDGWTKSLLQMPSFDSSELEKYLIYEVTNSTVIAGA